MYLRKHGPLDRTKLDNKVYFKKSMFADAVYDRYEYSGSNDLGHIKRYDILKHAEDRLSSANSDLDRIDRGLIDDPAATDFFGETLFRSHRGDG